VTQQALNAVVLGGIYTLFALGLSLAWGVLRILNLAHGAIATWGAITAWLLTKERALPLWLLIVVVVLAMGTLNVVIDQLAFRRLRRQGTEQLETRVLLASVGVVTILLAWAEQVTKSDTYSLPGGIFSSRIFEVVGVRLKALDVVILVVSIGGMALLAHWIRNSRNGRALRAIACDPETASLMGVNHEVLTPVTMFVSGGLAGMAGLLIALAFHVVHAYMGDPLMLKAIAIIILGGIGSVAGAVVGAYALAFGETVMVANDHASLRDVVAFAFVVLILLVKPTGLFGRQTVERQ
jgi:branched-chain amino acid transport system permease protein